MYYRQADIGVLLGKVATAVERHDDEIHFTLEDGSKFGLLHQQDCCENVNLEDVVGDLDDLVGSPFTMAEEATNEDDPGYHDQTVEERYRDSYTWTFYKFATLKGYVTVRFYGTSNGYYSERADFVDMGK